jgi:hypothetical protein
VFRDVATVVHGTREAFEVDDGRRVTDMLLEERGAFHVLQVRLLMNTETGSTVPNTNIDALALRTSALFVADEQTPGRGSRLGPLRPRTEPTSRDDRKTKEITKIQIDGGVRAKLPRRNVI